MGCFLEFLYTGDYFPKKVPGQRTLEKDPSIPDVDMTGDQLLKHAKVYTLAEKFGLVLLKNLASSKIHCVNSTAKGEIAYARYVYAFTSKDDSSIRVPVANFWATRSHTLRSEAEDEFRALCLEYPQFGYDVLSMSFRIPVLPSPCSWCSPGANNDPLSLQPASSTRSSSASATKRCTLAPPAARASGPGTAARLLPKRSRDRQTNREVHQVGLGLGGLTESAQFASVDQPTPQYPKRPLDQSQQARYLSPGRLSSTASHPRFIHLYVTVRSFRGYFSPGFALLISPQNMNGMGALGLVV